MPNERVAVVAGGTGGIGEGVVKALLGAGYHVFVPFRPVDRVDRLRAYVNDHPALHCIAADLGDAAAVVSFGSQVVAQAGSIDVVVVSVGAQYFGYRLHRMPRTEWDDNIRDNLATHFNVQQVFIEQLRRQNSGVYITLVGPEADSIRAEAGMVSIAASAQKMLTRVLAAESSDTRIRVHTLTAHTPIHTRSRGENTNPDWITAEELGKYVLGLVAGRVPRSTEVQHELHDLRSVRALLSDS